MLQNILALTKKFISIKSTADNKKALRMILNLAEAQLVEYTVEKFERNGIESVLIYNTKKRPKRFKIILNGHLDVIPGKEHQYEPKVKGDKLCGVGSMDMKANVACLIMAFKEVANQVSFPLGLQLVTDEQIGGFNGTKHQIEQGVRADFVIAGEPTNFDIVNQAKGVLQAKIIAKGKAAHSAYPWKGDNAIWKMNKFFNVLQKKYPILKHETWATTVNLSKIETTNQAFNKIPDNCIASLDIRFIPKESKNIERDIRNLLPNGCVFNAIVNEPALFTDKNNKFIKLLENITKDVISGKTRLRGAHGTSDARHFSRVNCPGVEFGPVGGGIGSDKEWVDIPSLNKYYQILKEFLLKL